MISLALNTAISNEVASSALLQFDAVNLCDTTAGTAQHHAIVILVLLAHNSPLKSVRQQKTAEEDITT